MEAPVGAANNSGTVSDEDDPMTFIPASESNKIFPVVITCEGFLDKDVADFIEKFTTFPVNEAQYLVLSNHLVKKHLMSNIMTIIEIIKVFKKAKKGLLKAPYTGSGSLLAGISTSRSDGRVEFSPDMLVNVNREVYDQRLSKVSSKSNMIRFYAKRWNFKTKRFNVDSRGLASCVKLNGCSLRNKRDVLFAGVLVYLVNAGILIESESSMIDATDEEASLISEAMVIEAGRVTRSVLKVALQVYYLGLEGKVVCDQYLYEFYGGLISGSRIVGIIRAIFSFRTMYKVLAMLTIKEVEDLTHTLKWFSTPQLVKRALTYIPYPVIAHYFDPYALLAYRQFDEAGLAAQIASGPLSPDCCGNISPLAEAHISPDLVLSQLARISVPYHEPTIHMAKMILDAAGISYAHWYQGNKAGQITASIDYGFKACVDNIFNVCSVDDLTNVEGLDGLSRDEVVALMADESAKKEDQVIAILRGWV